MARMIQISDGRYIPETEMTPEQVAYYEGRHGSADKPKKETMFERGLREEAESVEELMKEAAPKTPLEAAIDKATGYAETGKDGRSGAPEPQPKEAGAEARQPKTDWVEEAYKCFIKDAGDIDPTDPVKAVEAYFQKNATDELKARCKAEGKDAKGCWRFIEAVARKALHRSSGHIDPGVIYAIAMHWFEDVPKDWDKAAKADRSDTGKAKKPTTRKERLEERVSHGSSKAKAELRELKKKERAKAAKAARPDTRKKKPKQSQGFFFEMLETPVVGGEGRGDESPRAEQESEVKG